MKPTEQKNILALDGGGVRGIITLAFLEELESQINTSHNKALHEYFDLIGGTSTGAIIASGLSIGLSAKQLIEFYMELGPAIFKKSRFRIVGWQSVFDAKNLKIKLEDILGDRRFDDPTIQTYLAIVAKRLDTGSPWIVHNNPNGKFWDDPIGGEYLGNRSYQLAKLVRASTAAPHYFEPEEIEISDRETGLFVDGGVSPHNLPALAFLNLATIPAHGYNWQTGVDKLNIVSIGTGTFRQRLPLNEAKSLPAAGMAIKALSSLIADNEISNLTILQSLGECTNSWYLNSEIEDLAGHQLGDRPLFRFSRLNVALEDKWLDDELSIKLSQKELELVRDFTNPNGMEIAYEIGKTAAKKQLTQTLKFCD